MLSETFPDHLSCFSFRNSFKNASLLLVVPGGDGEERKEVILAKKLVSQKEKKDKINKSFSLQSTEYHTASLFETPKQQHLQHAVTA